MPHSVGISILLNETEALNTSVIVRTNATKTNDLPMVRIRFDESHSPEINPLCNTFLTLLIDTPSNRTESFNFSLWTQEESGTGDATIVIRKISVKSVDKTIFCFHFNVSYNKTENSTVQNFAMVHMKYINSAKINTSHLINLSIEIYIDPDKIKFCSNHIMFVSIGNLTNKYKLRLKLPEVFNDQHKRLIGQLHVLFDNDNNTCLTLPNKGNLPLLFWTRIQTSWFGINASEFEITLTGKGISCQMHGEKVLKVSFPVSNSTKGFNGDFNFCKLTYDGEMKNTSIIRCVYRCLCRSEMECSEVFLFLANNGDVALWNLCDISADNI
ncbi:uncharacterized protein LOC134248950 [Saccostrea cucullata]|uniref:uncharacterized protein LOC134248950 n=1 Tax=Saccostrea cuccullata TaxID=36930 RepID=UPI002ED24618